MSQIYEVYHVVTERPMHLGQHIIFDDQHHSGVYERVQKLSGVVEDIYRDPEKYRGQELEYPLKVALRELALEEVRREQHPDYPSRMSCLYVSETLQEAAQWAEYFISLNRPTFSIVKMRVSGNLFAGDATKCFDGCVDHAENCRMAARYWENGENPPGKPPIKEILVSGDLEVVEIIREFQT